MNMANYAKGLLDELEGAVRTGASELAADIRAELEKIAPEARQHIADLHGVVEDKVLTLAGGDQVENKLVTDIKAVADRLDAALATPAKRTAKAAAAPETATPPAAK